MKKKKTQKQLDMIPILITELKKLKFYYNSNNINAQTIQTMAEMWAEDFADEIRSLDLLSEAFSMARKRSEFLPKPKNIIECYRELADRQARQARQASQAKSRQIEHQSDCYRPTRQQWADFRWRLAAVGGTSKKVKRSKIRDFKEMLGERRARYRAKAL